MILQNTREVQVEIGIASDIDGDAVSYIFEQQYYCSSGKFWNQQWVASVNGNVIRIYFDTSHQDFLPHYYVFSAQDSQGAKVYRLIEVSWGGGSNFAPLYTTDYETSPDPSGLCWGGTVYQM